MNAPDPAARRSDRPLRAVAFTPRRSRATLLAMLRPAPLLLALLTALPACAKETPGPAGPGDSAGGGERACTKIGCENGVRMTLTKATPWVPGTYAFAFELDGEPVECKGALPLQACDAGPSLSCTPDAVVQVGESGCALPPEQHGFSDITVRGEPKQVTLKILHDDKPLASADITPNFLTSQPNGPGCEPICKTASSEVAVP